MGMYDTAPIYNEAYYGYGRNDIKEMTLNELKKELADTEKDLSKLLDEESYSKGTPVFNMKEQVKTLNLYRDKLIKRIEDLEYEENSKIK